MSVGLRGILGPGSALRPAAGPLLVALAFAALAAWTWGGWADVIVDFGRELYLPWRISQGDVLYRDLASFNGPLSPYVNALWFELAGASVRTLFVANLALLAAFTALAYRLLCAIGDRFAATLATLLFLATCAFGQQTAIGNYNFVAPYSHELTHGLLLGLAALAAMGRWQASGRLRWLALAGTCAGLALLTKTETALAALAGVGVAFATMRTARRPRAALVLGAAIALPPIAAALLLAAALPLPAALAAAVAPWAGATSGSALAMPFYRALMGIDHPWLNAARMLLWTGVWWLALAPALAFAENWRGSARGAHVAAAALAAGYLGALVVMREVIPWHEAARPLLVVVAAALLLAATRAQRAGGEPRWPLAAGFAAFALALLGKIALHPRLEHYGFALAAPALMLAMVALGHWLPARLAGHGAQPVFLRAALVAVAIALGAAHLGVTAQQVAARSWTVGAGADALEADGRAPQVQQALDELRALPPQATVLVLPEGVSLNFLARRRSPTRFVSFMPLEVALFGEAVMLEALARAPPDRVVVVHKSTAEYGVPWFGRDYGAGLMAWVRRDYEPEPPIGDVPLAQGSRFGIQVWRRRAP